MFFFFFNDTATTEIYTLSLHDALPICNRGQYEKSVSLFKIALKYDPNYQKAKSGLAITLYNYGLIELRKKNWQKAEKLLLQSVQYDKTPDQALDRKSTRLNSSHTDISRMPSSA